MGPSGQEDPEGSGAGSSPPLEGDVLWGQSPGDSCGVGGHGAGAVFPQLQLCSLGRGLCQGVLLLPSRMSTPPLPPRLPGRMQDWLVRLAMPFRTRRAPVLSEAVRDAPRLRLLHLTQAQAGEGEGPCTGCRPTQGTHQTLSQETHQLPGTQSSHRSCQPSEHTRSCPG